MFKNYQELKKFQQDQAVEMLDFKIVDIAGRWRHLTIPAERLSEELFEKGFGFDGSNYGFSSVENSDMVYIPELSAGFIDPFWEAKTLSFLGSIYEIKQDGFVPYSGDPRSILKNAVKYLKETGFADTFIVGPEFEFYIFDGIRYLTEPRKAMFEIKAAESNWNSGEEQSLGYKVGYKGGYHVDAPYDLNRDLRSKICLLLERNGINVKYHHHEVGGPGQHEIETNLDDAVKLADDSMLIKYFIKNLAFQNGKTATFMPKPIYAEAGNGFHVHMQLYKEGRSIFADDNGYCGLSKDALYFMGGILQHSPALMGIVSPSTNSYKRLTKGYEAPVAICFGSSNRTAVIRIPAYAKDPDKRRFEFRAPDASSNVYMVFASILMAGIDGLKNKIDPVTSGFGPVEKNIYDMIEKGKIKFLPANLEDAISELNRDHEFLSASGVFNEAFIQNWIKIKRNEILMVNNFPHPKEFELYFDI